MQNEFLNAQAVEQTKIRLGSLEYHLEETQSGAGTAHYVEEAAGALHTRNTPVVSM